MRLKTLPEDFRVRELLDWPEVPEGNFVVHVLEKEKLSTPEALAILVRDAGVDRSAIAYAGLKDRQAVTTQFLTIERRAVEFSLPNLRLRPVGTTDQPIHSRMSRGNAFTIVVRGLSPVQAVQVRRSLPSLVTTGFPNYFDDQRFGCLRHGQGFPMRSVLGGDFERALQQLVAEPSPVAITGDVKLKRSLQLHWGDWATCARIARGPAYQPLFHHLEAHPQDFRGALEHVPLRLRVIQAFAYQSYLWNRAVSRLMWGGVQSSQRLRIQTLMGDLLAWKYLAPEKEEKLAAMRTPLFGVEGDGGSEPFRKAMIAELQAAGLRRSDFVDHEVPGMVWREEAREVLCKPRDVEEVRIEPDERNPGRVCATLQFALPRGAYATMLVKRLFAPSWYQDRDFQERDRAEGNPAERGGRGDGPRGRGSRDGERDDAPGSGEPLGGSPSGFAAQRAARRRRGAAAEPRGADPVLPEPGLAHGPGPAVPGAELLDDEDGLA